MNPNYSHAAVVLATKNMSESIYFYRDILGFELTFTWEEPNTYAVLKSEPISLHLTLIEDFKKPINKHTALYIFVHDVEKVHREMLKKGVKILGDLEERDYDMKDFDIEDPAGHIITFGKGS